MIPAQRRRRRALWAASHGGAGICYSIEVTGGLAQNLDEAGTLQLVITPKDYFGNVLLGKTANYVSSDEGQATVTLHAGLVTAVGYTGGVNISITVDAVTVVVALTLVTDTVVTGVTVAPLTAAKTHPDTQQFGATAVNAHARTLTTTASDFAWTSTDPTKATVGATTGLATTLNSSGDTDITATRGGVSGHGTLTVTAS